MSAANSELTRPIELMSVAVVAFNEEDTLGQLLKQIQQQDFPHQKMEILLVDSASEDGTKTIMQEFASSNHDFKRVAVLDNPKRILPAGWNVLLDNYQGDAIVRIDAHANIPPDFVRNTVSVLAQGYGMCGGTRPCVVGGEANDWQRVLLAAEESLFGASIANYRRKPQPTFVDSVFHPAFRREVFDKVGRFDERLVRTEDNDISYRVRQAGYQIRFDPLIQSEQHIRPNLKQMIKQKYGNGYWIGRTLFIQPGCVGKHHLVPFAFVMSVLGSAAVAVVSGKKRPLGILLGAYGVADTAMSVLATRNCPKVWQRYLLPLIFCALHISYGWGTLRGIAEGALGASRKK